MKLVLLPGMDGTAALFGPFVRAAEARGFECEPVAYPNEPFSYPELVELVLAQLEPGVVLVAESFSGPIAIEVARRMDLRALVLVSTFTHDALATWQRAALSVFGSVIFRMPPPGWALRRFLTGDVDTDMLHATQSAIQSVHPEVLSGRLAEIVRLKAPPDPLHVPTLWLSAKSDRLLGKRATPPEWCVHQEIEGPHLLLQAAPKEAVDAIAQFLR